MNERIYLSPPHMSGFEKKYIEEAFKSNWVAPLGHNVDQFEREIKEYAKVKGAIALSSGTAAIHIALNLLDIKENDIVLCSTLTFVASANPILYQKAVPVFIDSEPTTWNMSPVALEKAIHKYKGMNKLPKAVIVVNLYGQSADMDSIMNICNHYGIPVIEDAAESLGALYKGKTSGTFGEFGVYSFNGNKIITTSGGGMLVTDDEQYVEKAKHLATQAKDNARHYQHSKIGFNYRMSNILAGIGRGQLKVLDSYIQTRRRIFNRYFQSLSQLEGFQFMPEIKDGFSTRWLTTLTVDPKISKISIDDLITALELKNIESRPIWKPLHQQPLFHGCDYFPHNADSSISDNLFLKGICLPSGSNLTEDNQQRVIETIQLAIKGKG